MFENGCYFICCGDIIILYKEDSLKHLGDIEDYEEGKYNYNSDRRLSHSFRVNADYIVSQTII